MIINPNTPKLTCEISIDPRALRLAGGLRIVLDPIDDGQDDSQPAAPDPWDYIHMNDYTQADELPQESSSPSNMANIPSRNLPEGGE